MISPQSLPVLFSHFQTCSILLGSLPLSSCNSLFAHILIDVNSLFAHILPSFHTLTIDI
jgi:hypothetical protein